MIKPKDIFGGYVYTRIKRNKNFLVCCTGPTGSGKTYTSLRLAQLWDKDFNEDRIVFTPQQFIDLLNSNTLKPGSVIVADEFGVSMNSRNWQSQSNQFLNYILQTFRSKNYIVIFTSPDFGFIDAAARKLFHAHFMTSGINQKEKFCYIKPYLLQINQRSGDVYYKWLNTKIPGQGDKKISQLEVGLPTKDLIKVYEKKKDEFVNNLNKDIEDKISGEDKKDHKQEQLDKVKAQKLSVMSKLRDQGKKWKEIAEMFDYKNTESCRKWFKDNQPTT